MNLHTTLLRPLQRGLLLLATLCVCIGFIPAQGAWSPAFDLPGFGIGSRVFGLGTWRNELIAGTLGTPWRDGSLLNHVARFDGVRWHPLGPGLTGLNSRVNTALEFQGDLYVGGRFGLAGTTPTSCVARWDGTQWHAVGAGFNSDVWDLCEHQGSLYAAGDFILSGTQSVRSLARWTGSQWVPVGGGLRRTLSATTLARTLLSDGNLLYVGGDFDQAGAAAVNMVAAWDGVAWNTLAGGITGPQVWALAKHNGRVYCGGLFTHVGGVATDCIGAWDGSQWHAVGAGVQGTIYGAVVHSLCVFGNDLYVAGNFNLSGATSLHRIARFDGSQLVPVGGVAEGESNPTAIFAMTTWNNRLYCGGDFTVAGEPMVPTQTISAFHLAAYDGSTWSSVGEGLGFDREVTTLGRYQGQTIVGGRFFTAGGNRAYCLARFDGTDWQYFGDFSSGNVKDMVEHNGELWVVGQFPSVNGILANGVARFDGVAWHDVAGGPSAFTQNCIASYQGMIHVGGTGAPKRWTGAVWETFAPAISGSLYAMHEHNGVLYIGGSTPSSPRLHAWDGTTATALGPFNNSVESLGSFGGELLVGGRFTTVGGVPARTIARWNGSSWSTFGIGIQGTTVTAMTTFLGSLVIGGDFNGSGSPADFVARWTGSSWAPLASAQPNGTVFALLPDDARGELLVGGNFFRIGTADAGYLGAYETAPFWTDVGQALASPRRAPRLTGDGRLLPGSNYRWRLSSAEENNLAVFVLGLSRVDAPVLGGTLVPSFDIATWFVTDGIGTATTSLPWFALPTGFAAWMQVGVLDPTGPQGVTLSNAVQLRHP